jgi:LPXTG-site transpeptidase (sortase) family protein
MHWLYKKYWKGSGSLRNNRKHLLIYVLVILSSFLLMVFSGCGSDNNVMQEPVEPEEIVEAEAEPEPEEIDDEPDPEPELMETVVTPVIIEEWQPMRLIIPAINLDLVCAGGGDVLDAEFLRQGPAHFQMSDLPSTEKGNVAFAGMWKFFDQIDNLVEGDQIYLDVAEYRFIYEVVWKEVVDKFDWEGSIGNTDYPSITLQTSYPIDYSAPNPDYRLNVRGELREVVKVPGY